MSARTVARWVTALAKGSANVVINLQRTECPSCDGTGRIQDTAYHGRHPTHGQCWECNGTGRRITKKGG